MATLMGNGKPQNANIAFPDYPNRNILIDKGVKPIETCPMRLSGQILAAGLLAWPCAAYPQVTAEQAIKQAHEQFAVTGCGEPDGSQIVVCGKSDQEFRLPLPVERNVHEHLDGDIPRASSDAALPRECGVFQGQRRCNLKELRRFGYGGGSVPLRILVMLAKKAVDPDAEIGPPKGYPVDPSEIK
ncbi:MAG: hypothetical protein ACKOPO_06190 [Novosphingobium sp.]